MTATTQTGAVWAAMSSGQTGLLVARYNGSPAVFTADPIPGEVTRPFVLIQGPHTEARFDSKNTLGTESTYTVDVVVDATGNTTLLDQIVDAVKRDLHRRPVSWLGGHPTTGIIAEVTSVAVVPTDGTLYARQITVRFVGQEN